MFLILRNPTLRQCHIYLFLFVSFCVKKIEQLLPQLSTFQIKRNYFVHKEGYTRHNGLKSRSPIFMRAHDKFPKRTKHNMFQRSMSFAFSTLMYTACWCHSLFWWFTLNKGDDRGLFTHQTCLETSPPITLLVMGKICLACKRIPRNKNTTFWWNVKEPITLNILFFEETVTRDLMFVLKELFKQNEMLKSGTVEPNRIGYFTATVMCII